VLFAFVRRGTSHDFLPHALVRHQPALKRESTLAKRKNLLSMKKKRRRTGPRNTGGGAGFAVSQGRLALHLENVRAHIAARGNHSSGDEEPAAQGDSPQVTEPQEARPSPGEAQTCSAT